MSFWKSKPKKGFNDLAFTEGRLLQTTFCFSAAAGTVTVNFNRWIKLYFIAVNPAANSLISFPSEVNNEIFSSVLTGTAANFAVNETLGALDTAFLSTASPVFVKPVITRSIKVISTNGTNTNRMVYILYQ